MFVKLGWTSGLLAWHGLVLGGPFGFCIVLVRRNSWTEDPQRTSNGTGQHHHRHHMYTLAPVKQRDSGWIERKGEAHGPMIDPTERALCVMGAGDLHLFST